MSKTVHSIHSVYSVSESTDLQKIMFSALCVTEKKILYYFQRNAATPKGFYRTCCMRAYARILVFTFILLHSLADVNF